MLWPMHLPPANSTAVMNNVVRHEINADYVAFSHACFFSPCDSAMYNALLLGYLGNFPRLTAIMFNQNKPNSVATAKGHLKQRRQTSHTPKIPPHTPKIPPHTPKMPTPDELSDEQSYRNSISTVIIRTSETINYSDMPGRFPFTSHHGHEYMLLSVYRGYIHIELMKSREGPELVLAYRATYAFFEKITTAPNFQMLDNEKSTALDNLLKKELKVAVELVPPNCHRRNRAERAIQDWKAHFIAGLATVDPAFPIAAWNELVAQGTLTINHLRPYTPDRTLSAYEGIHGKKYDFLAHPIYPPGVKVVVLEPADKRESWAPHGLEGYYLGPAADTYQSFRCWIPSTNGIRISDSISVHPDKLRLPGSSREEILYDKMSSVLTVLQNYQGSPADSTALTSLAHDIRLLTDQTTPTAEQRVLSEQRQNNAPAVQRVLPAPPTDEIVPPPLNTAHPTDSRARARAKAAASKKRNTAHLSASSQYTKVPKSQQRAKDKIFLQYVGRCYTDTDDGKRFQISGIVFPTQCKKDKYYVPFFQYYDMALHTVPPAHESDFEHTPCHEMIKYDSKTKIYSNRASYIQWNDATASSTISQVPTHGALYMAHALAQPSAPSTRKRRKRKYKNRPPSYAYSTFHSSATDQQLNTTPDGKPLTHRNALRGPDGDKWRAEDANEFRRLMSTSTIRPIYKSDKPSNKSATYYNPQVKEKLDSQGDKTRRTRGTLGGDRCNYEGPTSSPVADIAMIKTHQLSVVSDRRNHHTDTRYATIDIKDFYLGSKLDQPEYVSIAVKDIPAETMIEFDLHKYAAHDHVLFQVDGTMYGHPVAGRVANADLVTHLRQHDYIQDPNIPSFFKHKTNLVSFTLVVDDFGIKYTGMDTLDDLIRVLRLKYEIKIDLTGKKYVGISIDWDYTSNKFTTDMPAYIPDTLARFQPDGPRKKTKTPGIYVPPNYMSPNTHATADDSPPASPAEKEFIMAVVGAFLFYARMVDCTMLPITTFISKKQSAPTKNTLEATLQLLDYAASHPNHKVTFRACDMQLRIQSDGSHLSQENAGSIAGGIHYCCNYDDGPEVINGLLLAVCSTITTICGSASETEYASLYTNGQHGYFQRNCLAAVDYPQQPTTIFADNMAAVGVANDTVKLRKSKSYDMRYHWIRDRVRRNIFKVIWASGTTNDADFFTKIQPSTRHQHYVSRFVHT